jgi:hypothetical protein
MNTEEDDVLKERPEGSWKSSYPPEARSKYWWETKYLFCHFAVFLLLSGAVWLFPKEGFLGLDSESLKIFQQYFLAWSGGTLGGTAFSLKWLYHAIAKKGWHEDRRIWRFCTPHLSGLLAVAFFALLNSGLLNIVVETPTNAYAFGFGFIVGYFSDHAAAKLRDIADGLFGKPRGREETKNKH